MVVEDELIDLIYGALLGECPWQDFLEAVARKLPDGKCVFFSQGFGAQPEFAAIHTGMEEKSLQDYGAYYASRNPWIPGMEATIPGRSVAGHRLYPVERFSKSEFYNDFLHPINVETSGGIVIERSAGVQFNLTYMTSQKSHEVIDDWAGIMDRLSPHLRRAAKFYKSDGALKPATEFGASLFDSIEIGVLMVSHGPKLSLVSETAHEINESLSLFRMTPVGKLQLVQEEAQNALIAMLRRGYDGPKIHRCRSGRISLTLLRVERDGLSMLVQGPSVVVIVEIDREVRAARGPDDLQKEYGLTRAELRILMGLLTGKSLPELALHAGLSHETLRSQQKGLFEKLEVRSQIQLLNRVHGDGRISKE